MLPFFVKYITRKTKQYTTYGYLCVYMMCMCYIWAGKLVIYEYTMNLWIQDGTHFRQGGALRRLWCFSNSSVVGPWEWVLWFCFYILHIPNVYFIAHELLHNLKKSKATTLKASLCEKIYQMGGGRSKQSSDVETAAKRHRNSMRHYASRPVQFALGRRGCPSLHRHTSPWVHPSAFCTGFQSAFYSIRLTDCSL